MKKLLVLLAVLFIAAETVFAAGSQSVEPKLDGTSAELIGVTTLASGKEGDDLGAINKMIKDQNDAVAKGEYGLTADVLAELKKNGFALGDGYQAVGKGFYDVVVKNADGVETHEGTKFTAKLQQITDKTAEVGLVHYSLTRGMEYVKATAVDKAAGTATFELKDTSPVMFVVKYNKSSGYTPAKTGVDDMPVQNNTLRTVALVAVAGGVAALLAKKRH